MFWKFIINNKTGLIFFIRYDFLQDHTDTILCCDFVKDRLISGSKDKSIKSYQFIDNKFILLCTYTGHLEAIASLSIAPCS